MYRRILITICLISVSSTVSWAQETTSLTVGEPVERELDSRDTHIFTLDLVAGQFVYGNVDQQTVDAVVTVFRPDDSLVGEFDGAARGLESFHFETDVSGKYRIQVAPFEQASGRYAIQVDLVEPVASTPEGKIDQLTAMYSDETPGGVVAIIRNGEVEFAKGFGMANLEYGIPNTPETIYHMASVSKQFTAFAIAMLAKQGKLSIDDDVRKHIPELHDFGETITLRHLLNHTSGLRDHWNLWAMSGGLMDDVIRQEDLVRLIFRQRELNFSPGSQYFYCNTGYMLLSEIVTRVSGQPFGEWMQENVFAPLEMTSTQIYDDHRRIVEGRAYSYSNGERGLEKAVLSYANSGATSLFATVFDLAKWLRNWHTAAVGGPDILDRMQERGVLTNGDTLEYALGVEIGEYRGLRVIQHGGADAGYRTMVSYYPEIDAGVVVLGNIGSFNSGQMARGAADAFFDEHMNAVETESAVAEDEKSDEPSVPVALELLKSYAGWYSIEAGPTLFISVMNGGLFAQVEGQARHALIALADTLFRIDVDSEDARVSFHLGPDDIVTGGTIHQNGNTAFHRTEPWAPAAEDLTEYEGRYYSPELETFYAFEVTEGQLVAQHLRHGSIELTPKERDAFSSSTWFFANLVFERNDQGEVSSLRVSSGRVQNLYFEKQND